MNFLNILGDLRPAQSNHRRVLSKRVRYTDSQTLEARIVPATLVNPMTVSYQDIDGDDVTVTFFDPILTAANVNTIFKFNSGSVNGSNVSPQQLRSINLFGLAAAAGTTVTTVATRNPVKGGDGLAALGQINATGQDLGAVTIDGDLGRMLAGDATTGTSGVADMTVHSMGRYGTVTGAVNLFSKINGTLGSLIVRADIKGAFVNVAGGPEARLDILTVGGSVIGGSTAYSGRVHSDGNMGKVTVAGDVIGGGGTHSGAITTFSNIAGVTIGGSLIGGSSTYAGTILSDYLGGGPKPDEVGGHIGAVRIGRDVLGGSGTAAGTIISESGRLGNVTIGGSLLAGSGNRSAHIHSNLEMEAVSIGGSVVGGEEQQSGQIESMAGMGNVTIRGSLVGGNGWSSGQVIAADGIGNVRIGRNVDGGNGAHSGQINSSSDAKMGRLTIGGSVRGGRGVWTGRIEVGNIGSVIVTGDIIGGIGWDSGSIGVGNTGSIIIGGSVRGGTGLRSGFVAGYNFRSIDTLRVNGDVVGGEGQLSGGIAATRLRTASLGGSLIGGTESRTGMIYVGSIDNLSIAGNIQGGSASGTQDLYESGCVYSDSGSMTVLTLGGALIAGTDTTSGIFESNGAVRSKGHIGRITIRGSIIGNATHSATISAYGQAMPPAGSDITINSINVTGRVEHALIHVGIKGGIRLGAGFDLRALNADAQIGTVTVGGDWIASSLVAGATTGADGVFGTQDDAKFGGADTRDVAAVFSRINRVNIGGQVVGTELTGDHFGIVAESVGMLSVGANIIPLRAGRHNDIILLAPQIDDFFGDLRLQEI